MSDFCRSTKSIAAVKGPHRTKWATTMTKWLVTKANAGTKWQLVAFVGPNGKESRGIVDVLAVRKNHSTTGDCLKRGDLFEMVLIQIKGGKAAWPTIGDIQRLRAVAKHHRAKCVVLAEWKKGQQPTLYRLKNRIKLESSAKDVWMMIDDVNDVF